MPDPHAILRDTFGYHSFRPLQLEIIQAIMADQDVLAILPTGAGKSLCFQIPALARPGLTLVISPLIALMKDQVDALTANGVAATFLNSSLPPEESRRRLARLHQNQYKLLYAAPERIMLSGFLEDLQRWGLSAIAVDEAHCISEWGHDFRPEYRQLAHLRQHLPHIPFTALTATATSQVREDIATQLQLRRPATFVASFNRPNLTYRVVPKAKAQHQVAELVLDRPADSGIVYVQSRKGTEAVAAHLRQHGVRALPYHAGLTQLERAENQEAFIRDKVQVVCATIAFGMGIDKPDVRFVIHADLPKNVEGYYQETGRAGRDGLPADCTLLFSRGDLMKNLRFLEEMSDQQAAENAAAQMRQMADFAEAEVCRRASLLSYFGESWPQDNCGACDVCLEPRDTFDASKEAQMLLSCLFRIRQHSSRDYGVTHLAEVLTGADTERIRSSGHSSLSTYAIGKHLARPAWAHLARQLVRLGYAAQTPDRYQTLSITKKGLAALKSRQTFHLAHPPQSALAPADARPSRARSATEIACDEGLFRRLRELRRQLADQRSVPPYVVFSDVALRHMSRSYPRDSRAFLSIPGVGGKKLQDFGAEFIREIASWLESNPPQHFD
jgi:ATP-dependent DNA helicase RecQ